MSTIASESKTQEADDGADKKCTKPLSEDMIEKADSGMDDDSQHSSGADVDVKDAEQPNKEDEDEEVLSFKVKHKALRILDDEDEDDTSSVKSLNAEDNPSLNLKEEDSKDAGGSSDSDDDAPVLISKKNRRIITMNDDEDSNQSLNTNKELSTVNSAQESSETFSYNRDIFDAESDDEQGRRQSDNDHSSASNSEADEGFEETIDPKLLKKLKKGAAKKDKPPSAKVKRKAAEEAMMNLHSETQRMIRESRANLPYHQPAARSVHDFLHRAQQKQQYYKNLKGARDFQKAQVLQEVLAKAKLSPPSREESPNSVSKDKNQVLDLDDENSGSTEEMSATKNSSEGNAVSESESSVEKDGEAKLSSVLECEMSENIKNECDSNKEETSVKTHENSADVQKEMDFDDLPDLIIESEKTKTDHETQSLTVHSSDSVEKNDSQGDVCASHDSSSENKPSNSCSNSHGSNLIDDIENVKEVSSADFEKTHQIEEKRKSKIADLIDKIPAQPRLSGGPNSFIDFSAESDKPHLSPGVSKLMDRFMKHSVKKEKKIEKDVDISIIQKEEQADKVELKEKTFTYHSTVGEDAKDLANLETPGAKLQALKAKLQVKMKEKREEARQKRQEVFDLDNEEGYVDEAEAILDNEEEMSEHSDTDVEEDEDDDFDEQYGKDENEKERIKNPFADSEAEVDDDDDDDDDDDGCGFHLKLQVSDDEKEKHTDDNFDDEDDAPVKKPVSSKKKSRVLCISDDEESMDYLAKNETQMGKEKNDDVFRAPANPNDSFEESTLTPFSKHISAPPTQFERQGSVLTLPVDDSQDLYGPTPHLSNQNITPAQQSQGLSFYLEDSQSQMLDADGFLKTGSSKKEPKKPFSFETQRTENMDELLGLCSGKFDEQKSEDMNELLGLCSGKFQETQDDQKKSTSCKSLFSIGLGTQPTQDDNMDTLIGLCSGKFVESSNEVLPEKNSKKRKAVEDEESNDSFHLGSDDDELDTMNSHFDKNELSGDEENDHNDDSDDEENVQHSRKFKGFTVGNQHGKIRRDFVDEEAELSGSEYDSDENLDLAEEEDIMELEEGDKDLKDVTEDELRNQVGRAHLKQVIDEDKRELMRFQEMYLQDGDLHSDGAGRTRRFRWKNIDDDTQQDMFNNSDEEKEEEETETDFAWRKERYEREKWLKENQAPNEEPNKEINEDSQFMKFGKVILKRQESEPGALPKTPVFLKPSLNRSSSLRQDTPMPVNKLLGQKKGSFLSRDKESLAKIAQMTKVSNSSSSTASAKNSRNFVFQVISPDKESANDKNMENIQPSTVGPKIHKAHTPSQKKPPAKKAKLDSESSFSQNSIFNLIT